MTAAWLAECRLAGACFRSFAMARFPGAFTGRISKPSLPKSNTFNGPPRSKPSRRHQSSGKTVWRFSAKVMFVAFMVIIHYPITAVCQGFRDINFEALWHKHWGQLHTFDSAEKPPCFEKVRENLETCQVSDSSGSFIDDFSRMVGVFWWS